jgi:hypothetical protein
VYYSFHYAEDVHRVQLIRNMGVIEGQRLLSAQDWEEVRQRGNDAIANWIREQMRWKSTLLVLVGKETATRPWVQYEIQHAWRIRKPMLGIRIHGLSSLGKTSESGPDPFTNLEGFVGMNPGVPIFDPTVTGLGALSTRRPRMGGWSKIYGHGSGKESCVGDSRGFEPMFSLQSYHFWRSEHA